jgi:hypothetical protein
MRRLWISTTVAIARKVSVGHHAIECMFIAVRERKRIGLPRARPSLTGC